MADDTNYLRLSFLLNLILLMAFLHVFSLYYLSIGTNSPTSNFTTWKPHSGATDTSPPPNRSVISIKYEFMKLTTGMKSVAFLGGCRHVPRRFPELLKLPIEISVFCFQETHSKPCAPRKVKNIQFGCFKAGHADIASTFDAIVSMHTCSHEEENDAANRLFVAALAKSPPQSLGIRMNLEEGWMQISKTSSRAAETVAESQGDSASSTFQDIYDLAAWGADGQGSGTGSSMEYTVGVRNILASILSNSSLGIKRMVDAPCGSFLWMPAVLSSFPQISYTGLDVACRVIESNVLSRRYDYNAQFYCTDVCHEDLPKDNDLLFSRDALQHLPLDYTFSFLANVKKSGTKYLAVGSYPGSSSPNADIQLGGYFLIDLAQPPFNLKGIMAMYPG